MTWNIVRAFSACTCASKKYSCSSTEFRFQVQRNTLVIISCSPGNAVPAVLTIQSFMLNIHSFTCPPGDEGTYNDPGTSVPRGIRQPLTRGACRSADDVMYVGSDSSGEPDDAYPAGPEQAATARRAQAAGSSGSGGDAPIAATVQRPKGTSESNLRRSLGVVLRLMQWLPRQAIQKVLSWFVNRVEEAYQVRPSGCEQFVAKEHLAALEVTRAIAGTIAQCGSSANKLALVKRAPLQLIMSTVCTPQVRQPRRCLPMQYAMRSSLYRDYTCVLRSAIKSGR